jgi:hypothetical protein
MSVRIVNLGARLLRTFMSELDFESWQVTMKITRS